MYGHDVLSGDWRRRRVVPEVDAGPDLVVEDAASGFCGAVVGFESGAESQSARTMRGLFTVPLSIELVSTVMSTLPFFFYDLKRSSHAQMIDELKERAKLAKIEE